MATCIHPAIPVLSPSFLYHPYIPSLNRKIFHVLVSFLFMDAHCIYFILSGILYCLRIFVVVYILVVFISCCWNCVICANFHCYYRPVIAILDCLRLCCCVHTCSVNGVLLVMCSMCIPVFIVTSAGISQLWVYLA